MINPRVSDLTELMEAIAEPGHLYTLAIYHDDGCPALANGGTLEACECACQLRVETWEIKLDEGTDHAA